MDIQTILINIFLLLACISDFSLALFILYRGKKTEVNLSYTFFSICVGLWTLGILMFRVTENIALAYFWNQEFIITAALIASSFVQFTFSLLEEPLTLKKKILVHSPNILILFGVIIPGPLIKTVIIQDWGKESILGYAYWLYGIYFSSYMLFAFWKLFRRHRTAVGIYRQKIKYVLIGIATSCVVGAYFNLILILLGNYRYIWVGPYCSFIMVSIIGYAIFKYKLLDIHFIIRKTITNSIWICFICFLICFISYPNVNLATIFFGFVVSYFVVIYLPRLKIKTESMVTHIIYKGKYDYLDRLDQFIERMVLITEEDKLIQDTAKILERDMDIENLAIFLRDQITGNYYIKCKVNLDPINNFEIDLNSNIVKWLIENKEPLLVEEIGKIFSEKDMNIIINELAPIKAKVFIPIKMDSDLNGIIGLGDKSTKEMYTQIDLSMLQRLGTQLAVALDYKRVEAELRKKQEYVAIGQLAFEITHEMKNLLVPIKTFIQLAPEKLNDSGFMGTFRRIADTNVDVINRKVEDILYFGKNQRLNLKMDIDLNRLLKDICEGLQPLIHETEIEIVEDLGKLPPMMVDTGLLIHVFNNLVLNAIDAMKDRSGKIRIRSMVHPHPTGQMKEFCRDWVRIEVKDDGEGIPEDVRGRIFDAFVTTKNRGGDMQKGGVGLGLAVVKRILDVHHGLIDVHSAEGKGTTFVVDLPVKQQVFTTDIEII